MARRLCRGITAAARSNRSSHGGSEIIGLQSIRDWVVRFNAGGPEALIDTHNAVRKAKLGAAELKAPARMPDNIILLPLPPRSPKLNPVEKLAVHAR